MRVVIAMDRDPVAEGALAIVGEWARATGAELLLLTVMKPRDAVATMEHEGEGAMPAPVGSQFGTAPYSVQPPPPRTVKDHGQALEGAHAEVEEYLRAQAARCASGCKASYFLEWDKHPAPAIARFAAAHNADMVVVGSHNRGAIKHALLGSVAEAVIRESPVPVLVVRDGMSARQT